MKRNRTWKQIASLILVLLMCFQSPVTALAEEWTDEEFSSQILDIQESFSDAETDNIEINESVTEDLEPDAFTSEKTEEEADGFTSETTELGVLDSETTEEIQVKVNVSKDGSFLSDKDGNPMAGRTVTLSGKSSYTMDDALKMAHDLYYPGGSEAGYDYHADDKGIFDGVIYRLWGYQKTDVPYIRAALNHDNREYGSALGRKVQNGDVLDFYIQQTKGTDLLAFFADSEITAAQGTGITLQLRQYNSGYSGCEGATIYIDGVEQKGLVTDASGNVTLPALESRETPYFITAKKLVESGDTQVTAISAAYARVTVVPSSGLTGEFIRSVELGITASGAEEKKYQISTFDGNQAFVIPVELRSGEFRASVTLGEDIPADSQVYAVYTNPSDGTVQRVRLSEDSATYLKNTSVEYSYKAVLSLGFEVRKNGNVLQSVQVSIRYKARLNSFAVTDSWGHELSTGFADSMDSQELEVTVPRNTEYIDISGSDNYCWGAIAEHPELISVEGAALTEKPLGGALRFTPDWDTYPEYKAVITLGKDEKKYISEETVYTITIKPGEIDYTPVLTDNDPGGSYGYYGIMQGDEAEPFTVTAAILREGEGTLSYQWYESAVAITSVENYEKIEGATGNSYTISTEQAHKIHYYKCLVTYAIDGKSYPAESDVFSSVVFPHSIDAPVIVGQPENLICMKGTPAQDISVSIENKSEFFISTRYQWYKNTENSVEGGSKIPGASKNTYTPNVKETGTTYYFCKIHGELFGGVDEKPLSISSDEITTDVVSVTVTEAPLPWEGDGSESSPYQIKTVSDLEAFRDKVNKEGFSFEDTYFQLADDITLPDGWKPIGATKNGRVDLQGGANLNAFSGIFDGAGHTVTIPDGGLPLFGYVRNTRIRNLNIYGKKIAGYGLVNNFEGVGLAGSAVEIDNVTLKSGSSTLKSGLLGANMTMNAYAGCSAAFVATIQNCTIEEGVIIGYDKKESQIGSIAGRMQGTVKNCVSYATVYGTNYVGGIIGTRDNALGTCTVTDCKFYGNVNASGEQAGGIVGGGYSDSSAPNGAKVTIKGCSSEGTITGKDKVGGILGADIYVAQTWDNCRYSLKNNSFTGTVQATGENAFSVGGIIGFYDSLNRIDDISNNYYREGCGAQRGVGFVRYVDTNCTTHETASGAIYINTESDTTDCPKVEGCGWQTGYNRTDDPLGADAGNLFSTEGLRVYVDSLELSGDYRTEFDVGEALDFSGMKVTAYISDGTAKELSWTDLSIEGYNPNLRGEQKLKLSYKEAFVELTVTVLKKDAGTITVSFTLLGDKKHNSDTDGEYHTLHSGNLETWVSKADYKVDGNSNVLAVLKEVLAKNNMAMRTAKEENYIAGITRDGEPELAEFTNGNFSGWMYTLNGIHSDLGVKEQYLEDGDEIIFHYTDDYQKEHDHVWDEKWTSDTEAHWHECVARYGTCDIRDNAKKAGYQKHNYGAGKVLKAATCKDIGMMEYTCVVCGYTRTEAIPKTSQHTYDNGRVVKAASCKEEGVMEYVCQVCGYTKTATIPKSEQHTYDNGTVTKAATYLEAGEIVYTCTVCGAKKTETIPVVPHTHNFTWKTISAATVFTPEKQEGTCTICGEKQNQENGSALKAVLKLNVTSLTLQKKQSTKAVKLTMANGDAVKSWTSSNKKIVTVDKNGKIKAGSKAGTAKITVTLKSGRKATIKVKVQSAKVKTTKITGLKTKLTLKKGKSVTLKPVVSPLTSQEKVTYTSSNKKVAAVTKSGVIKGKKKGTATITVKSGKVTKRIKVTVR